MAEQQEPEFDDQDYMPDISESDSGSQGPIEPRAHIFWDLMAEWPDNLPGYLPCDLFCMVSSQKCTCEG